MNEVLIKFGVGLALLLFSTQKFVGLSEKVSRMLRVSPLVVGTTLVAMGTSLPELTVSSVSIARHDTGLAMGNIVGANIVNILLVFSAGIFFGNLRIGTTKTQRSAVFLLAITMLFCIVQLSGLNKVIAGILFISFAMIFSVIEYKLAVFGRDHEDKKQIKSYNSEHFTLSTVPTIIVLILGIIIGGILVVNSIEKISLITGVSTTILGLTLTALATTLPELFTTVFSQRDKQEKIALGNIIGSNIYNLLLIGGIITIFSVDHTIPIKDWVWLISTTILFVFVIRHFSGHKPPRRVGVLFVVLLIIYLFTQ